MDGLKGGSATQPVNDAVKNKKIALEQEQSKRSLLPELMSNRNDTGTSLSHRNILKSDDISPTAKNAISAYLDNYKYEQRAHITQLLGFDDYA